MSEIVFGIGASHTTLMSTRWGEVDHLPRAHAFRDSLAQAQDLLVAHKPDLVVVVGTNHFRGLWLDMMPAFTIGVGHVEASGEHGTPSGAIETDPSAAVQICNHLSDREFDIAFSTRLVIDHGVSHAIQWLLAGVEIPVVPVIVNCFAPPLPKLGRCLALGDAIRSAVEELSGNRRVAVIGTGGLSHQLPFPDWRRPENDDDAFLVESWKNGRGRWEDYEERRRALIVGAPPRLNQDFDTSFLKDLEQGRLDSFPDRFDEDALNLAAGNGGNEVRTWLVMAAALGHVDGRTLAYSPMPEWLTGMAVAVLESK